MQIRRLSLTNVNSLVGSWEIDFSWPEIAGEGVFLLTGPTGAGKTSVLDALCIALYGRTPRVGRITESHNEVMSRGTAEMAAEVEFITPQGHFAALFSQRRARGRADGRLQSPRHELVDLGSGRVVASSLRETEGAVVQVTGMGFEQFTRAVLLAQNGFAAFLLASADDRAPLLERITGTVLYSRLSIAAHLRAKEESAGVQGIEERLASLPVPSQEERAELEDRLGSLQEALAFQMAEVERWRGLQARWQHWAALQEEVERLRAEETAVLRRLQALEEDRKTAALARRVAEAAPYVARAEELEAALVQARNRSWELQSQLARLREELPGLLEALAQAEEELRAARTRRDALAPVVEAARQQDKAVALAQQGEREAWRSVEREGQRVQQAHMACRRAQGELEAVSQKLGAFGITTAGKDAALEVEHTLATWAQEERELAARLAAAQRSQAEIRQALMAAREVESLEAKRKRLQPGTPCPLCGSLTHPYVQSAPTPSLWEERLRQADAQCAQISEAMASLRQRQIVALDLVRQATLAGTRYAEATQTAAQAQEVAAEARRLWQEARDALEAAQRRRWEITPHPQVDVVAKEHEAEVERAQGHVETLRAQAAELQSQLAALQAREEEGRRQCAEIYDAFHETQAALQERLRTLGFFSIEAWRAAWRPLEWVETVERRLREEEARLAALQNQLHAAACQGEELRASLEPGPSALHVAEALALAEEHRNRLQEERGMLLAQREEAARWEEESRRLQQELAARRQRCAVWVRLRELIGSADGKKFRNFAQGLTLDLLLELANQRLAGMNDRYHLVRHSGSLELAVKDNYRAGEIRSIRNLSGGETFVVSLALALALSGLMSRGEPLGCLFVDEGFGALDEDSLEMVLDSLFALSQEERVVGVISHLPALRERLSCHIAVHPVAPGRSGLWIRRHGEWKSLAIRGDYGALDSGFDDLGNRGVRSGSI
jgi:exonuclease SbcC